MPFQVPKGGSETHPIVPPVASREATRPHEPAHPADTAAPVTARSDEFELSPQAVRRLQSAIPSSHASNEVASGAGREDERAADGVGIKRAPGGRVLSDEETREVEQLRKADRAVRSHEQAHKATAGELAVGGPHYTYERGPDGRDYAVSGEVQIQVREGQNPEETVRLAQKARRAALAPAEPSAQDRAVAAEASRLEQKARAEMRAGREGGDDEGESDANVYPRQSLETPEPVSVASLYGEALGGELDTSTLELYG